MFQTEEERKEFIRQRNALYSRRKYHKSKLDMIALPAQAKSLQERNVKLKAELAHLTKLMEQAQNIVAHLKSS